MSITMSKPELDLNKSGLELRLLRDKPLILVVDDHPSFLEILSKAIENAGLNVVTASTFDEAVKTFDEYSPDGSIIDLRLGEERNGLQLIEELKKYDPTAACAIATAHPSLKTAKEAVENENIVRYLSKPHIELGDTIEAILTHTRRSREHKLHAEFWKLYGQYQLHQHFEKKTYAEVGPDIGEVLKVLHDRILGTEPAFIVDAKGGAIPFKPVHTTTFYGRNQEAYIIKEFSQIEIKAFIENSERCYRSESGINHARPTAVYYGNDGRCFALIPLVIGQSYADVFAMLGKDRISVLLKNTLLEENAKLMMNWQNNISPKIDELAEAEKARPYYSGQVIKSLRALAEKSIEQRVMELIGKSPAESHADRRISDSEIGQFSMALDGFSWLSAHTIGTGVYSLLSDNSHGNLIMDLGIRKPTREQLYEQIFSHQIPDKSKDKDKAIGDILKDKPDWRLKQSALSFMRNRRTLVDSHHRIAHTYEDFVNFFNSLEAGLTPPEIINHFSDLATKKFGDNPTPYHWMDYASVGLYKSIWRQCRILTEHVGSYQKHYNAKRSRIGQEQYRADMEDYARKALHWGNQALWFASLGHLVAGYLEQGLSFREIKENLGQTDFEAYKKGLLHAPQPKLRDSSSLQDRMHYLLKSCSRHMVPHPVLAESLIESIK